ncbi:MAG: oligopeptide ABC transporter substrate-binding protein OppA [Chlamydiales bacterium]
MQIIIRLYLIVLLCAGCVSQQKPDAKKTLRLSIDTELSSFDPRKAGTRSAQIILGQLFEGLMRVDHQGNLVPAAAERIEMSPDALSVTFFLRSTYWSDGNPLTAADFARSWKEALYPQFPTDYALAFYIIKNGQAVKEGKLPPEALGIKVLDNKILKVEFETPAPFFPELTANPLYAPVPPEQGQKQWVSNGPFVLSAWKPKEEIRLSKNSHYREKDDILIDGITLNYLPDAQTALMMWKKGDLDLIGGPMSCLPRESFTSLREINALETLPSGGVFWLGFNTEKAPFSNKKIRQALAYAINRHDLVEHLLQGGEQPAFSVLPPQMQVNAGPAFKDADLEKARDLFQQGLKELGWTKDRFFQLELGYCLSSYGENLIAQTIQQQWNKAFGIEVPIKGTEKAVYLNNAASRNYDACFNIWYPWMNDPLIHFAFFKTKRDRINMTGWESSTYQALLNKAEHEENPKVREALYREAERILLEEMPIVPLFHPTYKFTKHEGVQGLAVSNLGQVSFRGIKLSNSRQ